MVEIITINVKPGTRTIFHQLYLTQSIPIQKKWNIIVLDHGPSKHDVDTYYVIRLFKSVEDRKQKHDAFYGSDDWQKGPRTAILALIENLSTIVVPEESVQNWMEKVQSQK
jgi:hypothetical protein